MFTSQAILAPHELMHWIYHYDRGRFDRVFGTEHLEKFWSKMKDAGEEWYLMHPSRGRIEREQGRFSIPIKVFGDDGGLGKEGRSILEYHFSSATCVETQTRLNRLPMCLINARDRIKEITELSILEVEKIANVKQHVKQIWKTKNPNTQNN